MDQLIARIQAILNNVPGQGKVFFGTLTADRKSFRSLAACLLAVFGTFLSPPVLSLGSPPIEQGLRTPGSNTPILIAANYLLLAVLTLVAGAAGDSLGRKRFLQVGLAAVLFAQLVSMFWLGTDGFLYAHLLLNVAQVVITPMCVALAAFTFAPGVRPFAFGAIFSTQATAIGLSSTFYALLGPLGNGTIAFMLPITLCALAFRLIMRQVEEPDTGEATIWRELIVNVLWVGTVFIAVYGLVAYTGGLTSRTALLTIVFGLAGLVLVYRYLYRRLRRRGELQIYNMRGLAFAILASFVAGMVQATLFFQFWSYFADIRGLGPVTTTIQFLPFVVGMLTGTMLIVRLSTRFDARHLIAGGLILMATGLLALSLLTVDTPLWHLIVPIALLGLGLGLAGPARTSVILSAPPPRLLGSGAAINSASGQSGYALGVIVSSLLVTLLADSAFRVQLRQANLPAATLAQIEGIWESTFARAMAGTFTRLPEPVAQWVTLQFAPAFTAGLANTLLIMAVAVIAVAIFIYVAMQRGLKGSLMQPPEQAINTTQEQ